MENVKKGDIITANGDEEIVLARLEDLVFTSELNGKGGRGPVLPPQEIEDLIAYGWKVKGE